MSAISVVGRTAGALNPVFMLKKGRIGRFSVKSRTIDGKEFIMEIAVTMPSLWHSGYYDPQEQN